MQDIKKISCGDSLRPLRGVLANWFDVLESFFKAQKDLPWWYGERSSLSLLAGAAWRTSGWVALEEFGTNKRTISTDPETGIAGKRHGRCDLYLGKGEVDYAMEAKQAGQPFGMRQSGNPYGQLSKACKKSWGAAAELLANEASVRLAVTFIVPSMSLAGLSKNSGVMEDVATEKIEEWLAELPVPLAKQGIDAFAYYFPAFARTFTDEDKKRVFPGVLTTFRVRYRGANGETEN